MRMRRTTSWRPPARGFTLVEALAGSLLMASLLVAMLLAMSRMNIQSRRAEDRVQACAVLDSLMQQWWRNQRRLPQNQFGQVPGRPGWRWQTRTINNPDLQILYAEVVAVEVFSSQQRDAGPAARLEILQSPPEETPDSGGGG